MYQRIIVALTATVVVACAPLRSPSLSGAPAYSLLQPQRDSFVVLSRGRAVGFQRTNLERTEDGYRLRDEVRVEGVVSQATEVDFRIDGSVRSVAQSDEARGQQTHVKVTYADDEVRGSATTVTAGRTGRAIASAMPANDVDDNLVAMLIPTLAWSRGAHYTITTAHAESGNAESYALTAIGSQRVTVPSGTYDTYVVELMGDGPRPLLLNVTTTRPHRIVRIVPAGQLIEFVLASSSNGPR